MSFFLKKSKENVTYMLYINDHIITQRDNSHRKYKFFSAPKIVLREKEVNTIKASRIHKHLSTTLINKKNGTTKVIIQVVDPLRATADINQCQFTEYGEDNNGLQWRTPG